MESLGDILKRVTTHQRPQLEMEPEKPVCPNCNGARFLSVPLKKVDSHWVYGDKACRCQTKKWHGQTFTNFLTPGNIPDLGKAAMATRMWAAGKGPGILVLNGPRGVGKSHLSRAALNDIKGVPRWYRDGQIIGMIMGSFGTHTTETLMATLAGVEWLIIDDFGANATTPAVSGILDDIIDSRIEAVDNSGGRTMITTNLSVEQMTPRTNSRLRDVRRVNWLIIDALDFRSNPIGG